MDISPTPPSSGGAAPRRRFTARVLRPVFQFVDVDVEATSDGEAAAAAACKAAELPEDAWDTDDEVNNANAVREVIRVVDHRRAARDAAEDVGGGKGGTDLVDAVFDALDRALYARRYLLLRADLDEVEGGVVLPPWLVEFGDDLELSPTSRAIGWTQSGASSRPPPVGSGTTWTRRRVGRAYRRRRATSFRGRSFRAGPTTRPDCASAPAGMPKKHGMCSSFEAFPWPTTLWWFGLSIAQRGVRWKTRIRRLRSTSPGWWLRGARPR